MSDRSAKLQADAYGDGGSHSANRADSFIDDIETIFRTIGRATLDLQAIVLGVSAVRDADVDIPANR
jgi:hypothetical protein